MKYKIIIEGGFTGISRKYEGEISVSGSETKMLLSELNSNAESQSNIPDGQVYNVLLEDGSSKYHAIFNEKNVPVAVRKLIDKVKQMDH